MLNIIESRWQHDPEMPHMCSEFKTNRKFFEVAKSSIVVKSEQETSLGCENIFSLKKYGLLIL